MPIVLAFVVDRCILQQRLFTSETGLLTGACMKGRCRKDAQRRHRQGPARRGVAEPRRPLALGTLGSNDRLHEAL